MQKIIMLSSQDGCIFKSPVAESFMTFLEDKKIEGVNHNLIKLDEALYLSIRANIPDFHNIPVLANFINTNVGKTIFVGDLLPNLEVMVVSKLMQCITLINQGVEHTIAYAQIFEDNEHC